MLVNDRLDKKVFDRTTSIPARNHLGIHFGVDDNAVKGVSHFPVFADGTGIHSKARPSAEEFIYTKPWGKKYNVGEPKHTHKPPNVDNLYDFDTDLPSPHARGDSTLHGLGNRLYGLPDLNIDIENFAAEEAGVVGITDKEMMRNNWREQQPQPEQPQSEFPEGIQNIINGGKPKGKATSAPREESSDAMDTSESAAEPKEAPKRKPKGAEDSKQVKRPRPVEIKPAFAPSVVEPDTTPPPPKKERKP